MSINTVRTLDKSQAGLQTSMERLSSGLRINHARDDAAGLAISEGMTSQIRGMNQAVRNTNDGISLVQTADGAMQGVTEKLQRVRELAVQATNGTNSDNDRTALDKEVQALLSEIDRVAGSVEFNDNKLLDGTFQNKAFQVGSENGDTITVTKIESSKLSNLSLQTGNIAKAVAGQSTSTALVAGALTVNGKDVGASSESSYNVTHATNGTAISSDTLTSTEKAASAIAKAAAINSVSSTTGVTAKVEANTVSGTTVTGAASITSAAVFSLNGYEITTAALSNTNDNATRDANIVKVVDAINAVSSSTGITASSTGAAGGKSVILNASNGGAIKVTLGTGAATDVGLTAGTSHGILSIESSTNITIGGTAEANAGFTADQTVATTSTGSVSVTTVTKAEEMITKVDAALKKINENRAELGAYQNRFEATVTDLKNTVENLSGARSRIQDADFAEETAALAKNQILQQAGMAMLAQANQLPQNVLSLLR